jgi:hypothetical protein
MFLTLPRSASDHDFGKLLFGVMFKRFNNPLIHIFVANGFKIFSKE